MNNFSFFLLPILCVMGFLFSEKNRKQALLSGGSAVGLYLFCLIFHWNAGLVGPIFVFFLFPALRLFALCLLILLTGAQSVRLVLSVSPVSCPVLFYLILIALLLWLFFRINWTGLSASVSETGKRLAIMLLIQPLAAFIFLEIQQPSLPMLAGVTGISLILIFGLPRLVHLILFREQSRAMMLELKKQDLQEIDSKRRTLTHLQEEYISVLEQAQDLLKNGKREEAGRLLASCQSAFVQTREHIYSQNPALNALLNLKAQQCRQEGIHFTFSCQPVSPSVQTIDCCLILSNFLDNAIRACRQQSDPVLELKMNEKDGRVLIAVINTCRQNPDTLIHQTGFGHSIIREIVRNYQGSLYTDWKDGRYEAAAVLYVNQPAESPAAGGV